MPTALAGGLWLDYKWECGMGWRPQLSLAACRCQGMLTSQARGHGSQPLLPPKLDRGPADVASPGPLLSSPCLHPDFTSSP